LQCNALATRDARAKKTAPGRGGGWALEFFIIIFICLFVVVVQAVGLCCVANEWLCCVVEDIVAVSVPTGRKDPGELTKRIGWREKCDGPRKIDRVDRSATRCIEATRHGISRLV